MLIRALSAIAALIIVYLSWYFFNIHGLAGLCSIAAFISAIEFSLMIEQDRKIIRSFFVCLAFSFFIIFSFFSQSFLVFLIYFMVLATYFTVFTKYPNEIKNQKLNSWIMGIIYCGALTGTITTGVLGFGYKFFIAVFILSFGTDTFAYLGGRLFGKRKLAPNISPNKTIEGALTGLIFGSGIGFSYLYLQNHQSPLWILLICCVLASLFSMAGDLFESLIKRISGVKDSGKMMPGHGGFLDRIDSLLFAGPVLYMWMLFFLK